MMKYNDDSNDDEMMIIVMMIMTLLRTKRQVHEFVWAVHKDSDHNHDPKTIFIMRVMENKNKIYLHKCMLTAEHESDFTCGQPNQYTS